MKDVDAEYYGYRDEDDGVLLPLEAQHEKQAVLEAVQKWRTEKEARLSGDKPEEDEEEESIYSAHHEEVSFREYPGWCPSRLKWTSAGLLTG